MEVNIKQDEGHIVQLLVLGDVIKKVLNSLTLRKQLLKHLQNLMANMPIGIIKVNAEKNFISK